MKKIWFIFLLLSSGNCVAQQHKTENLIVITLDGLRWQEVFGGIDEMQFLEAKPLGIRLDLLTYFAGREYLSPAIMEGVIKLKNSGLTTAKE